MYKNVQTEIKKYTLNETLHELHKDKNDISNFGMDNTNELLDGGFGLYSTANTKRSIGPIKTEYYRIAFIRSGTADFSIGLETFQPTPNNVLFGFPGQLFSLQNPTDDFFALYILFSENFIAETLLLKNNRNQYPFLTYSGVQCLPLNEEETKEIETLIYKINDEVKSRKANANHAIQLYIQLIFIISGRNYARTVLSNQTPMDSGDQLFRRFLRMVSEHYLSVQKVGAYAEMLHVSADHLNRTIKAYSDKTAHELIDEMIGIEAKAYLLHSKLSISEIAYRLNFSDPSHFNKFFKKLSGCTPLQYRNKSE
ncbi:MAG: helix-turn-helix domain-containing protein [Ignavibacteriae bacterium]|nr:helix-turn-helix domain-containing protein [Ignavibacteriota bacterium]